MCPSWFSWTRPTPVCCVPEQHDLCRSSILFLQVHEMTAETDEMQVTAFTVPDPLCVRDTAEREVNDGRGFQKSEMETVWVDHPLDSQFYAGMRYSSGMCSALIRSS